MEVAIIILSAVVIAEVIALHIKFHKAKQSYDEYIAETRKMVRETTYSVQEMIIKLRESK